MSDRHNRPEMDNAGRELMHGNKMLLARAKEREDSPAALLMNRYRFFICLSRTYDAERRKPEERQFPGLHSPLGGEEGPLSSDQSHPAAITARRRTQRR